MRSDVNLVKAFFTLDVDSGMSDRDRITLSPIEKWRLYKRFPFKLIMHAMLLALAAVQVRQGVGRESLKRGVRGRSDSSKSPTLLPCPPRDAHD